MLFSYLTLSLETLINILSMVSMYGIIDTRRLISMMVFNGDHAYLLSDGALESLTPMVKPGAGNLRIKKMVKPIHCLQENVCKLPWIQYHVVTCYKNA